ncbi:hypothetical protein E8E14_012290 [Neopestalotiopsis sp. 37M]|nr:hypothetical protein E8E14_012290 [Neopestalotiopsis sp. 37M]
MAFHPFRCAVALVFSLVAMIYMANQSLVSGLPVSLVRRGFNGMGIATLVVAVTEYLKTENAYDPSVPDKCVLTVTTQNGGNCQTSVQCDQTDKAGESAGNWSVCYVGGRQYFSYPELGDFSVQFTTKDQGHEGLTGPIIAFADYNNWEPWNLTDIIKSEGDSPYGKLCTFTGQDSIQLLGWECGVPKKGASSAFGMSLIDPDSSKQGYTPGWCTAHVNQFQKNEYGTGSRYTFNVILYDAAGDQIGHAQSAAVDANGHLSIDSRLPYTFEISVGDVDSDPVAFAYADQNWLCDHDTSTHDCTLGNGKNNGYENGDREGDMGFTCDAPPATPPSTSPETSPTASPTSISVMVVGDSITQGADGDFTWRYRLWEWLHREGVAADFVGPYVGTYPAATVDDIKPSPAALPGVVAPPASPRDTGRYNSGVSPDFPRNHYAMWGRQAVQDIDHIGGYVSDYSPDYVLLMLGFNDIGWFVSDAAGTLVSVHSLITKIQASNPRTNILVGNVVQRTLIPVVNEQLPAKTTDYNSMLEEAIPSWSTSTSTVKYVDVQSNYDCSPSVCADGYDGLHPAAIGEFHIAQAFSNVLRKDFGVGKNAFTIGEVPARPVLVPTNVKAAAVPMGIELTWDATLGNRGYDVRSKRQEAMDWSVSHSSANGYWETWVLENESFSYQVRSAGNGDARSDWTDIVTVVAHPQTAPGPTTINAVSTGSGIKATWSAVTGYDVQLYQLNAYDLDDSNSYIVGVGELGLSGEIDGLTPGHHYLVSVITWTPVGGGFPAVGPTILI